MKVERSKISSIIEQEFDKFIDLKKRDVCRIDENILQVRQLLQLVRYAAVKEYYSGVLPKQAESNPESIHIHPAVKTLLQGKRPKLDSVDSVASDKPNFPTYLPPIKKEDPFVALPPRAFQHKQKRRIVVGNVSKWIPENQREGVATHKWMVYVRGDEENPDLPEVCRVRFYLHPSYKPHHEVDVDTPPWQLTRRGWGEFPLRVLIFFENNENRSVELVHQIKLDKTHSGVQMLGQETAVDVYLYKSEQDRK